jgi:hypothetical protein
VFLYAGRGEYRVGYNNAGKGNVSLAFNLCEYANHTCPDGMADFANIVNENNTCSHIGGKALSDVGVALIEEENPELGLILTFDKGGN